MKRRSVVLTLLAASVLFAGSAMGQRGGGHGGGSLGHGGGSFGHGNMRHGFSPHSGFHNGFNNGYNNGYNNGFFYPFWDDDYWDDEPYWNDEPVEGAGAMLPAPPSIVVQPQRSRSAARELPPANPKMIEVQGGANSAVPKVQPPAIFVLTNGERLEVRRYLLTNDTLYLTINRHERSIPITMLDIDATTAANRERGVEVRIPAERSEISLSF